MKIRYLLIMLIFFSITVSIVYAFPSIPPTPSFSLVLINGEEIKAKVHNDILNITTQGIITTEVNQDKNIIVMKLQEITCPILQGITGFDENGNMVCGLL